MAPLLPSILLAHLWWDYMFYPALIGTLIVAYTVSIFILLPCYLILIKKNFFNLYSVVGLSFIILFLFSFAFYTYMVSDSNLLIVGGQTLVESEKLKYEGYIRAIKASLLIGLHGVFGTFIFSIFIWEKNSLVYKNCINNSF